MQKRPLEAGIHRELSQELSYSDYLGLDKVLNAQYPLSDPEHHDEMLFIIQHQTTELWFKLIIHELRSAINHLKVDEPGPCEKNLARVRQVQRQLFEQWGVLSTLTPAEYTEFRGVLGRASGFQSPQYRLLEFLLGNKNRDLINIFQHMPDNQALLQKALDQRSLYDEFLAFLARRGHQIPNETLGRDFASAYVENEDVCRCILAIYQDPDKYWTEYALCERLIDVEESFQLWRFRHMKTVERIIGYKIGTGGSSGVGFLKQALDLSFFPELWSVRTKIGSSA